MSEIAKNYNAERINRQKIEDYLNKKMGCGVLSLKLLGLRLKTITKLKISQVNLYFKYGKKQELLKIL